MFRLRLPRPLTNLAVDHDYERLPFLPTPNSARIKASTFLGSRLRRRRRWFYWIGGITTIVLLFLRWAVHHDIYSDIRYYERALPQHRRPPNPDQRLLWFEGQLTEHGLNNVLQEILMMSHVAYSAGRSFVFQDYVWRANRPYAYVKTRDVEFARYPYRPALIPLNAFISGPTAGGEIHSARTVEEASRRAVSYEYFLEVCPPEKQVRISGDDSPTEKEGKDVLEFWEKTLKKYEDEPCLAVKTHRKGQGFDFDWELLGSPRGMSLYDALAKSPMLRDFEWSPTIQEAVARNEQRMFPSMSASHDHENGLIAVHVRRGDYEEHCRKLWDESIIYMGMAQAPWLTDRFDPPPNEPQHREYYYQHCYPSVSQLVERLRNLRKENPGLKRVYVLSNASKDWLAELKEELLEEDWEDVKNTNDLSLSFSEYFLDAAVDMAIGTKAQVFLGNGFSSLSSNIIMLRDAQGFPKSSNRLL